MKSSSISMLFPLYLLAVTPLFALSCAKDGVLEEARQLREKVCACEDRACVAKLEKSSKELETKFSELSGRDLEHALEISVAIMECSKNVGATP